MSSKEPLALPIEGYSIDVKKTVGNRTVCVDTIFLRLSKVGGAHIRGVADLVTQIEDAVFKQEEKDAEHNTG